jgi:hypothetical protein
MNVSGMPTNTEPTQNTEPGDRVPLPADSETYQNPDGKTYTVVESPDGGDPYEVEVFELNGERFYYVAPVGLEEVAEVGLGFASAVVGGKSGVKAAQLAKEILDKTGALDKMGIHKAGTPLGRHISRAAVTRKITPHAQGGGHSSGRSSGHTSKGRHWRHTSQCSF